VSGSSDGTTDRNMWQRGQVMQSIAPLMEVGGKLAVFDPRFYGNR